MHRWCLLNLTVQGFSLNLTVRGVSHKHCLLTFFIISADAKGKDSMILFKIKETAHINFRPHVVLKFGVARDDGLDARKCTLHIKQWPRRYEQVKQVSCADPGFFVGCVCVCVGGGSGQKTVWTILFFSHQLILQFTEWIQWFYYRGEEGSNFFHGEGVSKEAHITCDFPGGGGGGGGGGVRIP